MTSNENMRPVCKITVITVCFNASATVGMAMDSVLSQEYPEVEYILIDGGSTDGTREILDRYRERLAYTVSEPDHGIYDAFNKGLRLASGDIIGILNADDQYAPWALATIAKAYSDNPGCGVFYGKLAVVDEERRKWTVYPLGDPTRLKDRMSIAHPAVFVTRGMYEKHGFFDERYKIAGDWDFMLRLFTAGEKFCPVNKVLAAFTNSGVSSVPSRRLIVENREIYNKYLTRPSALAKNVKMELKYLGRSFIDRTGLYNLYSRFRDGRILSVEGTGEYLDHNVLWTAIQAVEIGATKAGGGL